MKFNYLFTFMLLCFSGVLSGVINGNSRLSKRYGYVLHINNPTDYKLSYGSSHRKLDIMYLSDGVLSGGICLYRPERCATYGNFDIKLDYESTCNYGNSKIKRIAVHDSEGDPVSEIINLSKLGQNKFSNRYITFYFENGCKFTATYNYQNAKADYELRRRVN